MPDAVETPTWETTTEEEIPQWADTTEEAEAPVRKVSAPPLTPVTPAQFQAGINPYERARQLLPPGERMTPFGPENPQEILSLPQALEIPPAIAGRVLAATARTVRDVLNPQTYLPEAEQRRPFIISPEGIRTATPQEAFEKFEPIQAGRPLYQSQAQYPSDAEKMLAGLTTPESLSMLAAGAGPRLAGWLMLTSMAPGVVQQITKIASSDTDPDQKRDEINNLLLPVILAARAGYRGRSAGAPDFTHELTPLEFTGEALPGRPRGAVPVRPTAGPEVLGPEAPPRVRVPEVPGAAEPVPEREPILGEIRRRNARTRAEIQKLFPQLSQEEAGEYRRLAWGGAPDTGVRVAPTIPIPGPVTGLEIPPKEIREQLFKKPEYEPQTPEWIAERERFKQAEKAHWQQQIILWERELAMAQNRGDARGQDNAIAKLLEARLNFEGPPPPVKPPITPKAPPPGLPRTAFPPEVPATPPQERETVLAEIRRNNARTRAQIQALFPKRQLSNEEAAALRNEVWGKPEQPAPKPEPPPRVQPHEKLNTLLKTQTRTTTNDAIAAGLNATSLADLEELFRERKWREAQRQDLLAQVEKETDPDKKMDLLTEGVRLGYEAQLMNEAIEAATKYTKEELLPLPAPLDWKTHPEVKEWLLKNAASLVNEDNLAGLLSKLRGESARPAEAAPPPAEPVPPAAPPSAPAAPAPAVPPPAGPPVRDPIIAGLPLSTWERRADKGDLLTRGPTRVELAARLGVKNNPADIIAALKNKRRLDEIFRRPPPGGEAPPAELPTEPPAGPPAPEAQLEDLLNRLRASNAKIGTLRNANEVDEHNAERKQLLQQVQDLKGWTPEDTLIYLAGGPRPEPPTEEPPTEGPAPVAPVKPPPTAPAAPAAEPPPKEKAEGRTLEEVKRALPIGYDPDTARIKNGRIIARQKPEYGGRWQEISIRRGTATPIPPPEGETIASPAETKPPVSATPEPIPATPTAAEDPHVIEVETSPGKWETSLSLPTRQEAINEATRRTRAQVWRIRPANRELTAEEKGQELQNFQRQLKNARDTLAELEKRKGPKSSRAYWKGQVKRLEQLLEQSADALGAPTEGPAAPAEPADTPPAPVISQAPIDEAMPLRPIIEGVKLPEALEAQMARRDELKNELDKLIDNGWDSRDPDSPGARRVRKIREELGPLSAKIWDRLWEIEKARSAGNPTPPPRKPEITTKVLKAQRENLLGQVDQAIKEEPGKPAKKVTFSVPGDGDWTIPNTSEALTAFRKIVEKDFPKVATTAEPVSALEKKVRPSTLPKLAEPKRTDLPKIAGGFVSKDKTRFAIQTAYSDGTQIVATDGRRLLRIVTPDAPGSPAEPVRLTEKGEVDKEAALDSHFPNYNQVTPTDPTLVRGGFNIEDLWKLARQAQSVLSGMDPEKTVRYMRLFINPDGSFGAKADNPGVAEFQHNIQSGAYDLGAIDPEYLEEGLYAGRQLGNEKLDLYADGENGPLLFVGKNHEYTVMGMRTSPGADQPIRDNPSKIRPSQVGQKIFTRQPQGLGPLLNPEMTNARSVGNKEAGFWRVTYRDGGFEVEHSRTGEERDYGGVAAFGFDKESNLAPAADTIRDAVTQGLRRGGNEEATVPANAVKLIRGAMEAIIKQRDVAVEEYKARVQASKQSMGPGAAAASEFDEGPPAYDELQGQIGRPGYNRMVALLRNTFLAFPQLFLRRPAKGIMMQLANAASNWPKITGLRAASVYRGRWTPEQLRAVTMLMQAFKMSGEGLSADAAERLGELEFAGDPSGYLRAKEVDMSTLAQRFNNEGKKLNAQAALDAARAYRFARLHFNELRPAAQALKKRYDSQWLREKIAEINVAYEDWYVPQRHELDLVTTGDGPIVLGHSRGGGGLATQFQKAKFYEDYASAIEAGFIPRSLNAADLLEHRVNQGEALVWRKTFFSQLRRFTDPHDGKAVAMKPLTRIIERPDGSKDVQFTKPKDYEWQEVTPGARMAIHKGYARLVRALMGTSQIADSAIVGTLQDIAGFDKHISLAIDTFHASRTLQAELALTGRVSVGARQRLGRALVEYEPKDLDTAVQKGEITQEMADWIRRPVPMEVNGRTVELSPASVFKLGLNSGMNVARFADALYRDWLRNLPVTGAVQKWVFDKMTRSAMSQSFLVEFQRVAKANPQLTANQVGLKVASDLNLLFGNLQKESIFRNPSLNSINQILFLAPRWVEALARREGRAVVQLGQAGFEMATGRKPLSLGSIGTVGRAIGTGLSAYFVATQLLNLATRRQLTFYNQEEGHKLDAWVPDISGRTGGFFISPLSVFAEITHDLLRFAYTKPDFATALSQVGFNKLGNIGRMIAVLSSGRDPLDGHKLIGTGRRALTAAIQAVPVPIVASRALAAGGALATGRTPDWAGVQRQAVASLGFKTEPVPTANQQVFQMADRWKTQSGDPRLEEQVDRRLQQDFGPSEYKPLRTALAAGDMTAARNAYEQLRRTKSPSLIRNTLSHPHPFTGSSATERRFRASLTPEERATYDKALEERRELYRRYRQMLSTTR